MATDLKVKSSVRRSIHGVNEHVVSNLIDVVVASVEDLHSSIIVTFASATLDTTRSSPTCQHKLLANLSAHSLWIVHLQVVNSFNCISDWSIKNYNRDVSRVFIVPWAKVPTFVSSDLLDSIYLAIS